MSESKIQAQCKAYLDLIPGCQVERIVTGRGGKNFRIRGASAGTADLMGAFRGRPLAVEIKSDDPTARRGQHRNREGQRTSQLAWQAKWEVAGGVYLLVTDVDELAAWVAAQPLDPCGCAKCCRKRG